MAPVTLIRYESAGASNEHVDLIDRDNTTSKPIVTFKSEESSWLVSTSEEEKFIANESSRLGEVEKKQIWEHHHHGHLRNG